MKSKKKTDKKRSPQSISNIINLSSVSATNFQGLSFDIYFSIMYLKRKYNNFLLPVYNINPNKELMWQIVISWKLNNNKKFVMELPCHKQYFLQRIKKGLKKDRYKFIIIPIFLGSKNVKKKNVGHFNILIINKIQKTVERFDPYGYDTNYSYYKPFDKEFMKLFQKKNPEYTFMKMNKFLPKYAFQSLDEEEVNNSIASNRNTDPGGFCGAWIMWYTEICLKYPNMEHERLANRAIKIIKKKKNKKFRNFIRNYSEMLIKEREKILTSISSKCKDKRYLSICFEKYLNNIMSKKLSKKLVKV